MDPELIALLDNLDPEPRHVSSALAFLRLVARNNPGKSAAEINRRPDVAEATALVDAWLADARRARDILGGTLAPSIAPDITAAATKTIDQLDDDTRLNDQRLGEWGGQPPLSWAAKIVLRMGWLTGWLRNQAKLATAADPYKRWVSRLAPNTCQYCRALHGVVIPVNASFALEAARAGFIRPYGGLYAPPLHPNCQCTLDYVATAQYELLLSA